MGLWDLVKREGKEKIRQELAEREAYDEVYKTARIKEVRKQAARDAAKSAKSGTGIRKAISFLQNNVRIGPDPKLWKK